MGRPITVGEDATKIGVEVVIIAAMVVEEVMDIQDVAGFSNFNPHNLLLGDHAHLLQVYRLVLVLIQALSLLLPVSYTHLTLPTKRIV